MNTEELYEKADLALKRGEVASWEAAEAMAALADQGETQRQIAKRLGRSVSTVNRYIQLFRVSHGNTEKLSFTEAMAAVRTDTTISVPRAPEQKAELAAKLLKDKEVADAPAVREIQQRHAERRRKEDLRAWDREHGIPTRTEREQEQRRLSVVANNSFWHTAIANMHATSHSLREATRQIDRTGLPNQLTGEMLKTGNAMVRDWERFKEKATHAGIGDVRDVG